MVVRPLARAATLTGTMALRRAVAAVAVAAAVAATVAGPVPPGAGADQAGNDAVVVATLVLSVRRLPAAVVDATARTRLADSLNAVMAASPPDTCLLVTDGDDVVYHAGTLAPLTPASVLKVVTGAAAVDVLGPRTRFTTSVSVATAAPGGVVDGNVYLVGGGDPVLVTDGYARSRPLADQRVTTSLEELADAVAATGITAVAGSVVGDATRFDTATQVPTWDPTYLDGTTVGPLGALRVNGGFVGWTADPGRLGPVLGRGDPAALAAQTFTTLLARRGVQVAGAATTGVAPPGSVVVAQVASAQLDELVADMVAHSDNAAAEMLVKELGRVAGSSPTTAAGLEVVARWLSAVTDGADAAVVLTDGSGLDTGNRMGCATVEAVLVAAAGVLDGAMAVSGTTGTLAERLGADAAGRIRAKTGTLNGVRGLAGYADTDGGDTLTFAYLANAEPFDPALDVAVVDLAATALLAWPQAPPVADVSPLAPVASPTAGGD